MENFITSLQNLASNCNYGELRDEMIRDRIVVGIRDRKLSDKFQCEAELTLEKAVDTVRTHENVRRQQMELAGGGLPNTTVNRIDMKKETRDRSEWRYCEKCGGKHGERGKKREAEVNRR